MFVSSLGLARFGFRRGGLFLCRNASIDEAAWVAFPRSGTSAAIPF
jgi:hypothetical protein